MANLPVQQTLAVLQYMADGTGGPIATHWMDRAAGCPGDTAKTRRFLVRLRNAELVDGVESIRSGRVWWWKITDKGRAFLTTFAHYANTERKGGE